MNGRLSTIIDNKNHANFSVFKINLIKDSIGYYIFIVGLVIAECNLQLCCENFLFSSVRADKMYANSLDILGFWKDSSGAHGVESSTKAINLSFYDNQ